MAFDREKADATASAFLQYMGDLQPHSAPPESNSLFHYTSAAGLHGIVSSGALRATNYAFLNDLTEMRYGIAIARGIISAFFSERGDSEADRALRTFFEGLLSVVGWTDAYVTSFCLEPDLLSQWRAYGSDPRGRYCIEFSPVNELTLGRGSSIFFGSVDYNERSQMARVGSFLIPALQLLDDIFKNCGEGEFAVVADWARGSFGKELFGRCLRELPFMKHPSFSSEQEWRLAVFGGYTAQPGLVEFDSSTGRLRPYVNLQRADSPRLPIRCVFVGASRAQDQAMKAAEMLLARHGYLQTITKRSHIPLAD